jgi:hypothetical protein
MSLILASADSFEKRLCEILKLDPHKTTSITIKIQPNSMIEVNTEQVLFEEEGNEILKILKYYHLEPNKDEPNKDK